MLSWVELIQSFVIALILIFCFKMYRKVFAHHYWATSDILGDIEDSPSLKSVSFRFLILLVLGVILNSIFITKVVIFGMTLGSFLIIWPILLSDENIEAEFLNHKYLLRSLLILYVVTTFITAYISTFIFQLGKEFFLFYLQDFNFKRLVQSGVDSLIWFIIGSIVTYIRMNMGKKLNTKVNISSSTYNEDFHNNTSEKEGAATLESEIEERINN